MNQLLEFLRGSKEMYLELRANGDVKAYSDADWADDRNDRKSTSGHIIFYRGAPVHWSTSKQKSIAASTMESEYISLSDAAREAFYTKKIAEFIEQIEVKTTVYCDNVAAQTVAEGKTGNITKRAKHIEIRYHLVRNLVLDGLIEIHRIESTNNPADLFTKPLPSHSFNRHSENIGLAD